MFKTAKKRDSFQRYPNPPRMVRLWQTFIRTPPPLNPGSAPDVRDKERLLSAHPGREVCLAGQVNVEPHLPNGQDSWQVNQ